MKVLILLSRVPFPLEKGDKLRAFHQIKWLSAHHEIFLCCLNDGKLHPDAIRMLKPYCSDIEIIPISRIRILLNILRGIFSSRPFQVSYFYHKNAQKIIDRFIEKHLPRHIYCQLIRVSEYAKKYTIIPKTLDYMDAFSTGMERRASKAPFYLKFLFKAEARRLRDYESYIFTKYENKTIISTQDKELIRHHHKNNIRVISNGVDTDYFKPIDTKKDFDLVFTGNMNYPPNIESACYIARQILPKLRKKSNSINLLISGASPSLRISSLASPDVTITGWVNDIRLSYARARIFLAPMQTGTGLQNKLLEAMAMRLPCVTSTLANNALGAKAGEEILVSESLQGYIDHVERLLYDPGYADIIADNGFRFVMHHYNWKASTDKLSRIISGNRI